MAVLLNGTNGLIQAYDYQTPTTGFSYTFAAGTQTLVMNPAGTLAAGTITMPAAPSDGMTITFSSTQQITALTLSGNTGQTVVGGPTQLIANQPLSFIYRSTNTTWYANAGGAGRATSVISGTSVASTSGTAIDFTGIPSWVKRVTVMFNGVSLNSTSTLLIQLGTSSGVDTSGYFGNNIYVNGGSPGSNATNAGVQFYGTGGAANANYGTVVFTSLGSANTWTFQGGVSTASTGACAYVSGAKGLSGALDRVRITSTSGTDTFDAGSVNIIYE
jgi:hypothetical protein